MNIDKALARLDATSTFDPHKITQDQIKASYKQPAKVEPVVQEFLCANEECPYNPINNDDKTAYMTEKEKIIYAHGKKYKEGKPAKVEPQERRENIPDYITTPIIEEHRKYADDNRSMREFAQDVVLIVQEKLLRQSLTGGKGL
jgi:hypothetical protein